MRSIAVQRRLETTVNIPGFKLRAVPFVAVKLREI
jgi:hypothetical protein